MVNNATNHYRRSWPEALQALLRQAREMKNAQHTWNASAEDDQTQRESFAAMEVVLDLIGDKHKDHSGIGAKKVCDDDRWQGARPDKPLIPLSCSSGDQGMARFL